MKEYTYKEIQEIREGLSKLHETTVYVDLWGGRTGLPPDNLEELVQTALQGGATVAQIKAAVKAKKKEEAEAEAERQKKIDECSHEKWVKPSRLRPARCKKCGVPDRRMIDRLAESAERANQAEREERTMTFIQSAEETTKTLWPAYLSFAAVVIAAIAVVVALS